MTTQGAREAGDINSRRQRGAQAEIGMASDILAKMTFFVI